MPAKLIGRYKRFLADVRLNDGTVLTVHCPNTGSMKNCQEEGAEVWLSESSNPKRKYRHTWEMIKTSRGHFIGINAGRANELVTVAIEKGKIETLKGYSQLRREVKYGDENSRIDIFLEGQDRRGEKGQGKEKGKQDCYVEVKSVTLLEEPFSRGVGFFPDAVSERGAKHLRELILMREQGHRAVLFFCAQHTGIREVRPADHIDGQYGRLIREASRRGVEVIAHKVRKTSVGLTLSGSIPVVLPA
ncbi:MAG: sugar fermentation stimulation protein A [Candidatus Azotimanducaceae bacterium]|jgi:sugar fermentation stimulation protein A